MINKYQVGQKISAPKRHQPSGNYYYQEAIVIDVIHSTELIDYIVAFDSGDRDSVRESDIRTISSINDKETFCRQVPECQCGCRSAEFMYPEVFRNK